MATAPAAHDSDWDGVRLHVVTGKGGTGKTTVAAALALALAAGQAGAARRGRGRQGISQTVRRAAAGRTEERGSPAPGGGEVFGLAVDAKAALLEYLQMFYKLGRAGGLLERFGAIDFATTIAPGVRDVLLTGKVYEAVRRSRGARRGHGQPGVRRGRARRAADRPDRPVPRRQPEVAGLARVGPDPHQADSITRLLRSPQTAVHLVTLLEEMPVQETLDARRRAARGRPAGRRHRRQPGARAAAARRRARRRPRRARSTAARSPPGSTRPGCAAGRGDVDGLLDRGPRPRRAGRAGAARARAARAPRRPAYRAAALPEGMDVGALRELAELLREQGMA